jgi:hypothetical protein
MIKNRFFNYSLFLFLSFSLLHATQKKDGADPTRLDHRALKAPIDKKNVQGILLATPGTQLKVSGQIAQEHVAIRNGYSLNTDVSDWIWKFRQRIDLTWHSTFYGDNKELPAAEAKINLLNMHWWKEAYSNLYMKSEPTLVDYQKDTGYLVTPDATLDPLITPFNNAIVSTHIPVISFTEGWIATYFDRFCPQLHNRPLSFKIGYFPYQLGRGISLGTADEGGVQEFGYQLSQLPFASPFFSPGILLHGTVTSQISYELYYALLQKRYEAPFAREAINFKSRLDKSSLPRFGKETSSQVWAGKVLISPISEQKKALHAEAYCSWLHSTLNMTSPDFFITDRDSNIGTFGVMLDCRYKQLECNIECAAQIGSIAMHPLDKNQIKLHRNAKGNASESFTKINARPIVFTPGPNTITSNPDDSLLFLAPAAQAVLSIVDDSTQYNLSEATPLHDSSGNTILDLTRGSFVSTEGPNGLRPQLIALQGALPDPASQELLNQVPTRYVQVFNAPDRFRKKYSIDLHGFSVLLDMKYSVQRFPCAFTFAGAYISGDKNPFAKEVDTSYNGFLPLKDIHYRGHFVKSLALLGARVIPRPCDGLWHQQDTGNLAYVGLGFECNPFKNPKMLIIDANFLAFFQPAEQPIARLTPVSASKKYASNQLGYELNGSITYAPLQNITLLARGALFFPGQLYKDREAQMLSFMTTEGTPKQTKIGSDIAWGYHLRLAYHF